jgi:hypothetical protein
MEKSPPYHVGTLESAVTPDVAKVRIPICNGSRQIVAYGAGASVTQAHANATAIAAAFDALAHIYRCSQIYLDYSSDETDWRDFARRIRDKAAAVLYPEEAT